MFIDAKLAELGITLPEVATPAGSYVPYVVSGNLIYVAGQIPLVNGKLEHKVTTCYCSATKAMALIRKKE